MASYMGSNIIAAQTITRNVALLFQVFAVGIQISCLILVGNSIGEGSARNAKQYYKISACTSLVVSNIVIALLLILENTLISAFTTNEEIISVLHQAWPLMLVYLLVSAIQKPAISTLRSTRIQFKALIVTFTAFWFIGIPLALILTRIYDWGIQGLWLG